MIYYVIRHAESKLFYGRNPHYKTTGNYDERHGWGFPPYLYSSLGRAITAIATNHCLLGEDVEVLEWNTRAMKKVKMPATAPVVNLERR